MPPTTASLKTHTGHGHHNNKGGGSSSRHASSDRHTSRHRSLKHISAGISTPTPVQQSSEGEDESWSMGGRAGGGGEPSGSSRSRRGQTEVEVIRDWFVNIFQPVEKTADLVVTDFKFEQLNHTKQKKSKIGAASNGTHANGRASDSSATEEVGPPFTVLKKAEVEMLVGGKAKSYSVVIKVLPTDDQERHSSRQKFCDLLKFSKEVQVYSQIIRCMVIFDEKRYASACVEPPVPKCYLGQLDAQNDVLVLENLECSGYRKYTGGKYFSDFDHCKVILRRIAHFHAFSTLIQRDADQSLLDLFPFAVDATIFRESFQSRAAMVRTELSKYLVSKAPHPLNRNDKGEKLTMDEAEEKVERHLQELFWRLVSLRAQPHNLRMSVLVHGSLDINNVMFQYDEVSGRPVCAKFLDFSSLTVSSPVIDISYFLHSSVLPEVASHHHSGLLQYYHRAHTEAIKSFGMHGYEMEMEDLLSEYHAIQDYGSMTACLLKPALYVLQCLNAEKSNNGMSSKKSADAKNGSTCANNGTGTEAANGKDSGSYYGDGLDDISTISRLSTEVKESNHSLKIDKTMVPVDLRLHSYLSTLARACPCPCSVGSREMTISELSADSLEDLHIAAKQQGMKGFDCNGGTKTTLKKFFFGFRSNSSCDKQNGSNSKESDQQQSSSGAQSKRHPAKDH